MESDNVVLSISGPQDVAESIDSKIRELGGESRLSERKGFSGATAEWIIVGAMLIKTLMPVLEFIAKVVDQRRVASIRVGDLEIKNPTRADIEDLKARYVRPQGHANP